jgi:hypothetical protein
MARCDRCKECQSHDGSLAVCKQLDALLHKPFPHGVASGSYNKLPKGGAWLFTLWQAEEHAKLQAGFNAICLDPWPPSSLFSTFW